MSKWQDPDLGKAPEQLFAERTARLNTALQLKQPDRIPVLLSISYLAADMMGLTRLEAHEDFEKSQAALEQAALYWGADTNFGVWGDKGASEALGDQMTQWPGYGLGSRGSFQFVEKEFMLAEDYDAFINDPSDWCLRTYLPRAFSNLAGFGDLPPFGMLGFGYYHSMNLPSYGAPAMRQAIRAIARAIECQDISFANAMHGAERMAALGFPAPDIFYGALIEAPFDFMSDTLRGMRGILLDMHKRPDKLLAAQKKCLDFQVEFAIQFFKQTGIPYPNIPLHRGSDGFMSLKQFEQFYWPNLKEMILRLIDAGMTPFVFWEGIWDQRLDYLAELPKGKTIGMFQSSDIFKVKEKLGDVMCIIGGMPNSLLSGGTVEEVRAHTRKVCEEVGKGGGFIMSSAVGDLEGCDPDLIKAWVDATKEYGAY